MVYSNDRSKAVVPVLVLLFVALWFILRGDLFLSSLVLFCSCVFFSDLLALHTSLGEERELIFVLFVRLFDLPLFGFVCFLSLLVSGKCCSLCLCHSLDFSLTLFVFNSTSRYLDDLLNIDNIYFDQMVDRIYPTELQLNKTNSSDTEALFFGFESMYI